MSPAGQSGSSGDVSLLGQMISAAGQRPKMSKWLTVYWPSLLCVHANLWASCIQGQPASRANQSAANPCSELNDLAASATPDMSVTEDAPTLEKVIRAVRRLRNGQTAGFDEIAPELLKYAEARGPNQSGSSRPLFNRLVIWQSSSRMERGYNSVII